MSSAALPKRIYDSTSVPLCPRCSGKRAFEFQLMPNLINVVRRNDGEKETYASEEQRVEAVRASLQKGTSSGEGMEWGTCFVFSCAGDCDSGDEVFTEEEVLVQWED
jgi:pre-rRNA-processing protein TSR4